MDPIERPFVLENRLCLNGEPLPFEVLNTCLEDPLNIAGGDQDDQHFHLLSVKAGAEVHWLEKALGVRSKFWRKQQAFVPLVREMVKAIEEGKLRSEAPPKSSRRPGVVVAIKIRDKTLLVMNKPGLVLALRPGAEQATLHWFLEELAKDLERLGELGRACQPRQKGRLSGGLRVPRDGPAPDPEDVIGTLVATNLNAIRCHSQCHRALFLPSRGCFEVFAKGGDHKIFYLKGYTKKRKRLLDQVSIVNGELRQDARAEETFRMEFEKALDACIQYLELAPGNRQPVPLEA